MRILITILIIIVIGMWYFSHEREDSILKFERENECKMIVREYFKDKRVDIICDDGKILHYKG